MIDKKPSHPSGSFDEDDLAAAQDGIQDETIEDDPVDTGELDAQAMVARQKRNGMVMTYGVGAAFALIVAYMAYPSFKHYFISTPAPVAYVGTAVPQSVRKNYFPDAGGAATTQATDNSMPGVASIDNSIVGLKDESSTPSTSNTQTEGLPPPPSVPVSAATGPSDKNTVSSNDLAMAGTVAAPIPSPAPSIPASDVAPAISKDDLKDLKDEIDQLKSSNEAQSSQIQTLQATVDNLQKQVVNLVTPKIQPATATVTHQAPGQSVMANWQLRSAIDGSALLGKPNSGELKHVAVGDLVSGLGKITSIKEQDGRWVVEGTGGSISQ